MKNSQSTLDSIPDDDPIEISGAHMIARVNALAVKMAFPFKAREDVRRYLCGINIRPLDDDGVMIVATDGHRYLVVRDPHGFAEREITVIIEKDALKHMNSSRNTVDVMSNGTAMVLGKNAEQLFIQPGNALIEEDFPRIERIASTTGYTEGISGAFNPNYLADLFALCEIVGSSIRFFTRSEDSPLQFTLGGIGEMECFGGVMKMRDSFTALPTWFPRPGEVNSLSDV